jgi:hypothetical protein
MKISGFTMVRNATKLYYPIRESIESILPICDEFVVALGRGDEDDTTEREINSINSDKIKIVHTEWDVQKYTGGTVYAQQTDVAKSHCTGDWLFYIQSDEVIHEKYLPVIRNRCEELLDEREVEGLLFDYKHFWGDYQHYIVSHAWYPREIRIVRNHPDIHSWRDAQSFRRIPGFDGNNYKQKEHTFKLSVARVNAEVFHYGWVRPPHLMQSKRKAFSTVYRGEQSAKREFEQELELFDYGDLSKLKVYQGSHPAVLAPWIEKFNWREQLFPQRKSFKKHKHDKLKYRILTFLEQNLLGGELIGGFKNYNLIRK